MGLEKVSVVSVFSGFCECSSVAFAPDDGETVSEAPSTPGFTVSTLEGTSDPAGAGVEFATEVVKELDNRALRELSGKAELPT